MGGLERRPGDQRLAGGKCAGDRVDGGDLQSGAVIEVGEQRWQAFGEHRLSAARRAHETDVVTACRADLQDLAALGLPANIGQVELTAAGPRTRRQAVGGRWWTGVVGGVAVWL